MEHKKFKEWLKLYIFNELGKTNRQDVESHLTNCNECKKEFEELYRFYTMVKSNISKETNNEILFEARQELFVEIRKLNRKKSNIKKLWEFLTLPTFTSLKIAYSFASVILLFFITYLVFFNSGGKNVQSENNLISEQPRFVNIQFTNSDFKNGEVEICYEQITPFKVKGNLNDFQIQKILVQSLISNDNPGIRLNAVNAILSKKQGNTSELLQDALIKSVKYDNNPGVRKEAMKALCNLPVNEKIIDAMTYVLQNDSNSGLRIQSINSIDKINDNYKLSDPNTINVLKKKMYEDQNSYIKLRAKTILTKLQS